MKENYEPLFADGMLELIDGDGDILEGISAHCVFGHTKAMQMIRIQDDGKTLLFPSDLMPMHSHVPYPFVMGYDNFPLTTIEEKKQFLPQAYEEKWLVCFQHDAFYQAAYIEASKKGFRAGENVIITEY
jgi:glyoxylase-like metal-dependent hydrolase (beta-lactamase superfamily II)